MSAVSTLRSRECRHRPTVPRYRWLFLLAAGLSLSHPCSGTWNVRNVLPWSGTENPRILTSFRGGQTVVECAWEGTSLRGNGSWWQIVGSKRRLLARFEGAAFRWISSRRNGGAWSWVESTSSESAAHWPHAAVDPGILPGFSSQTPRFMDGRVSGNVSAERRSPVPMRRVVHSWLALPADFVGTVGCGVWNSTSEVPVVAAPSLSWEEASPPHWAVECHPQRSVVLRSPQFALLWWLNGSLAATVSSPHNSWGPQVISLTRVELESAGPGSEGFSYADAPADWGEPTTATSSTIRKTTDPHASEEYDEMPASAMEYATSHQGRPLHHPHRAWFDVDTSTGRLLLADSAWDSGSLCVACAVLQQGQLGIATSICRSKPLSRKPSKDVRGSTNVCAWSATAAAVGGLILGVLAAMSLAMTLGVRPPRRGSMRLHNSR